MNLSATIKAGISAIVKGASVLGALPTISVAAPADIAVTNGTTAGKCDLAYTATITLAASGTLTLVLGDGSLKDAVGDALTFVKVRAIYLATGVANAANIEVGGAASHPIAGLVKDAASDKIVLRAGESLAWQGVGAGFAITAGTAEQLKFTNTDGGAGATVDVIILGTSA